jgi:uncharacterized membrane protein
MMWSWGYNNGWPMAGLAIMVVFWAGFFLLAAWTIRIYSRRHPITDSVMDTLRLRLASGQITAEEFEQTRKVLQG